MDIEIITPKVVKYIHKMKTLPLFKQFKFTIIVITTERVFEKKGKYTMTKQEELIDRLKNLTPEQLDKVIALYSQQEQEFAQAVPIGNPTSFQHAV